MSVTRRKDNNRIQEKDDKEVEATVFNSQETPSDLFTLGGLGTEENSGKLASWEFPTALSLLTEDWRFYFYNKGVVKRLKYLSGTVSSSSNARHYT